MRAVNKLLRQHLLSIRSISASLCCTSTSFSRSLSAELPLISTLCFHPTLTFIPFWLASRPLGTWSSPNHSQPPATIPDVMFPSPGSDEAVDEKDAEEWEEEELGEDPKIGDGGDGGGVVFDGSPWAERAFSIAEGVLSQYGAGFEIFAFKITRNGYIYLRLDKLANEYGCPTIEELESFCQEYRKRLDEAGENGDVPTNLALEVSSPGTERLLKVPDDLTRFKEIAMRVRYVEENMPEKEGFFVMERLESENRRCLWKLANVKENRIAAGKGRPFNRKMRNWRLDLPFDCHKKVTLYVGV